MDVRRPKLVDGLLLAAGLYLAGTAGYGLVEGWASLAWPKVDGMVTYSGLTHTYRTQSQPDIRYRYTVEGSEHTGNRWRYIFVVARSLSQRPWYTLTVPASYPVGQRVKVSVRPGDPSDAVLEPGISIDNVLWTFIGAALVAFVLVPQRKALRPRRFSSARIAVLAGVGVTAIGLFWMYHGVASGFWPTAPGKVLFTTIGGRGSGINPMGVVRYEYAVDGARLLGERTRGGSREIARAWVAANPVGHVLTVHYNPLDPADSEIAPGIGWRDFLLPAIGLAALAFARVLRKYDAVRERWEEEREAARTTA